MLLLAVGAKAGIRVRLYQYLLLLALSSHATLLRQYRSPVGVDFVYDLRFRAENLGKHHPAPVFQLLQGFIMQGIDIAFDTPLGIPQACLADS